MRKCYHKKDVLIGGIKSLLDSIECQMIDYTYHELDMLDSHFQTDWNNLNCIQDHFIQCHLTCLSILTFCDQMHAYAPSKMWFESVSRILENNTTSGEGEKNTKMYLNLLYKQ